MFVGHQITGARGEIERALGVDGDKRGARIADGAVFGAELDTRLGADHHARAHLIVIAGKDAARE